MSQVKKLGIYYITILLIMIRNPWLEIYKNPSRVLPLSAPLVTLISPLGEFTMDFLKRSADTEAHKMIFKISIVLKRKKFIE